MKFSKEMRIGLLVAISIVVLFSGFYFLKGSDVFSKEYDYHSFYDNVQGLQLSAVVQIKGLQVGKVSEIKLNGGGKVMVTFSINKKTRIPEGTIAKLTSMDLLGTKGIALDLGQSNTMYDDDDTLSASVEGGLIDKLSVEISPMLTDVRKVINNVDSVLTSVNGILSVKAREDLQSSMASLHASMDNFAHLSGTLNGQSENLAGVIKNAKTVTDNLAKNNDNINGILANAKTTTDHLSKAPIEETVKNLQGVADKLNGILDKINAGQGSIGMAVNDKKLYEEAASAISSLNNLAADLKAHPSRYINVTVFGHKAKVGD